MSVIAFALQYQSSTAAAKTIWPVKPKIFTILPFSGKVFWLLVRNNEVVKTGTKFQEKEKLRH